MPTPIEPSESDATPATPRRKPFYTSLWVQVLIAMAAAVALGYFSPARAVAMKPLGDAFIRMITMIITILIFCTVVTGIAGMQDLKKVGRVGGKALLYFEIVSTIALVIGLIVGNVVRPGAGFNVNAASLDARAVADYAGQAKAQGLSIDEYLKVPAWHRTGRRGTGARVCDSDGIARRRGCRAASPRLFS